MEYKVKATSLSYTLNKPLFELHRVAAPGEEFISAGEARLKYLSGANAYGVAFVSFVSEIPKQVKMVEKRNETKSHIIVKEKPSVIIIEPGKAPRVLESIQELIEEPVEDDFEKNFDNVSIDNIDNLFESSELYVKPLFDK